MMRASVSSAVQDHPVGPLPIPVLAPPDLEHLKMRAAHAMDGKPPLSPLPDPVLFPPGLHLHTLATGDKPPLSPLPDPVLAPPGLEGPLSLSSFAQRVDPPPPHRPLPDPVPFPKGPQEVHSQGHREREGKHDKEREKERDRESSEESSEEVLTVVVAAHTNPLPSLLYDGPDGAVQDAEFLRAEKLFLATPQSEAYGPVLYDVLRSVRAHCDADYHSLCAPFIDNAVDDTVSDASQGVFIQDDDTISRLEELLLPFNALSQWLPENVRRLTATQNANTLTQRTRTVVPPSQRAHTVAPRAPHLTHTIRANKPVSLTPTQPTRSLRERHSDHTDHPHNKHDRSHSPPTDDGPHNRDTQHPPPPPPHTPPCHTPPPPQDDLWYGALGYGAAGDVCLTSHIAATQRAHAYTPARVSPQCVSSVQSLYALRESYVRDTQPPPHSAAIHHFIGLLLLCGALCGVWRFVRAKKREKAHDARTQALLSGLAQNAELRECVERSLSLSVPPPSHTHTDVHTDTEWTAKRALQTLLSLSGKLCVSLCVAVSSVALTCVLVRASGAERVDSEGETVSDVSPLAVLLIALSIALTQVLLLRGAVRCVRTLRARHTTPSAPPLLSQSVAPHNAHTQGDNNGGGALPAHNAMLWPWSRVSLPVSLSLFRRRDAHTHADYTALAGDDLNEASTHDAHSQSVRGALRVAHSERGESEMIALGTAYTPLSQHSPHPHTTAVYATVPTVVAAMPVNTVPVSFV